MTIAGIILIVFGVIDFGGSWFGFDLWGGFLGVDLPDLVWQFSAYAEIALGYFLMQMSSDEGATASSS